MNEMFQEYFLDDPGFRLVAILKCIKIFQNQFQRNPYLRLSTESLKNTCKKIYILEGFSVSINKIFEVHLWRNLFFSIYHTPR